MCDVKQNYAIDFMYKPFATYNANTNINCFGKIFHQFSDAPSVSVHLANEEPIPSRLIIRREHQNVTLKCRANANPPVEANSFGWYKNVSRFFFLHSCLLIPNV